MIYMNGMIPLDSMNGDYDFLGCCTSRVESDSADV